MRTVKVLEARGDTSIIQFGKMLQSDPDAKYTIYELEHDKTDPLIQPKFTIKKQGHIPSKGRVRINLAWNTPYMVMAQGNHVAGMIHSAEFEMRAPFYLSIDADPSQKEIQRQQAEVAAERLKYRPNILKRAMNYILNTRRR